ncbi:AraC family transcriptional regulator [Pseudoteredinibacter isoporae]|uniref:AraC-like DNA-binding protein n=1 Tax=Pseudoteredinibacter isoporae TaxID=570281 RepID=A0A7X0MY28_9GAMM|nr:AraC family transcriptional regulator [Pseudoteredinibacter isoporae]MBB6522619.1 AraC-like DNA-binding protein [Pseudoteredinibacter isoporae]NHO88149.1 AraC family transcriptional regulator [Pseudoteredinibacter isoporae]NIB23520.1 AraC family transcriptional regulator [Pseudoteredinibacter isoporae]
MSYTAAINPDNIKTMESYTSLSSWITALEAILRERGVSYSDVLADADIDAELLRNPYGRVDVRVIDRAWKIAIERVGDDNLGILSAHLCQPVHWHALGLAMLCSASVAEALGRVVQYQEILTNVVTQKIVHDDRHFCLYLKTKIPIELVGLEVVDFGFAGLLAVCRSIFPGEIKPSRVCLQRPEPTSTEAFEQFYGCTVQFGCEQHELEFPASVADRVLDYSDPQLAARQDDLAQDYIQRIVQNSFTLKTQDAIKELLPKGEPSQQSIAERLCLSPRQLQRQLQKEGSSFTALLRDVRMELAQQYLQQQYRPITEIALLLGFADHSNFTRAFKSWFDCTPTEFRERL